MAGMILCDLDGTLISRSSELVFVKGLFRRGVLSPGAVCGFFCHYLRHPIRTVEEGKGWNRGYLKGLPVEVLTDEVEHDLPILLDSVRSSVRKLLDSGAEQGHQVCVLSASLSPIVEAVSNALGFHCFRGSIPEVRNGRLTGNLLGHRPWGRAKVTAAGALLEHFGLDWSDSMALGDSWSDRYVMDRCGDAVAVDPGRRLRKLAGKKGWRVIE